MIEDPIATAIGAHVDAGRLAGAAALVWRNGKAHAITVGVLAGLSRVACHPLEGPAAGGIAIEAKRGSFERRTTGAGPSDIRDVTCLAPHLP